MFIKFLEIPLSQKLTIMDSTQLKIVEASTHLFVENGIRAITMDDVAQYICISKRTIYEKFANKQELLMACIDLLYEQKLERDNQVISSSKNIIEELFYLLEQMKSEKTSERRFVMEFKKYFPDVFIKQYATRYEMESRKLKERILRGVEQGLIMPTTDIDVTVFIIFETVYNLVSRPEKLLKTTIDVEGAFRYILISFFRGIATPKGAEMIDKMNK